jgi:phosphohistidine phosphatase
MRRLILMRHAKAEGPIAAGDHARALAPRGRAAAPVMGAYLAGEGLLPDLAVVSDARRTRETWGLVATSFAEAVPARFERAVYEASRAGLVAFLRTLGEGPKTLMLVGHNPGMAAVALWLAGHGDRYALARMRAKYPTSAVAVLDLPIESWADLAEGEGRLDRFVTPKSLDPAADED